MKTAVTIIETVQTGIDNWKDLKTTKVFDDLSTLYDIKKWIKSKSKSKMEIQDISLAVVEISDIE